MLPTLDQFLVTGSYPSNGYIKHPDFKSLYIRKNPVIIQVNGNFYQCEGVITLANLTAKKPGTGALKRLVADLVSRDKAIYIENVHESWFQEKLRERGFIPVNENTGLHYLFNHGNHLTFIRSWIAGAINSK
jgi:hypothetical protein